MTRVTRAGRRAWWRSVAEAVVIALAIVGYATVLIYLMLDA